MKRRLFVDMDGVLTEWKPSKNSIDLYEEGYFRYLLPQVHVVRAIKKLITNQVCEVFSLSAYLMDSNYALQEKKEWLNEHIPEIPSSSRIFVPCGSDKHAALPGGIRPDDILLDDYTRNLLAWADYAVGIKLLNGINHTHGTWKGYCVTHTSEHGLVSSINKILNY
jgi:Uncharacterized protein conserved in bacteria